MSDRVLVSEAVRLRSFRFWGGKTHDASMTRPVGDVCVALYEPELAPGRCRNLNACIALLTPVLTLAGCVGPTLLSSQRITVESLEGNYLRLAMCTYERLNRKDGRLRIVVSSDQDRVKIDFDPDSSQHWDLSFINEEPAD